MSKQRYDRYSQRDWSRFACRSWDELGIAQGATRLWVMRLGFPNSAVWSAVQFPPNPPQTVLVWLRTRLCDRRAGYYWCYVARRTLPVSYSGTSWWKELCQNS